MHSFASSFCAFLLFSAALGALCSHIAPSCGILPGFWRGGIGRECALPTFDQYLLSAPIDRCV